MARLSIGYRLTLWYSAVLALGLVLFAAGIWLAARHGLFASVDEILSQRAAAVMAVLNEDDPKDSMLEELTEYALVTPEGNLLAVRDETGRELLSTRGVALPWPGAVPENRPQTITVGSHRYRVSVIADSVRGHRFEILTGTLLDNTENLLRRLRNLLLAMVPVVMLAASMGGYWLSRRALAPVDRITDAARHISIQNLSQRLDVPATGDELQRLADTWNDMLRRLESAVKRLSQFTADASHELRTPIALIRTTAELTLRRERQNETYKEALRQIVAESERTTRLIEELLVLARADAGLPALPMDRLELTPLLREVCQQGRILAEARQVQLSADVPEAPVFVQGNDPALRRLFLVLLDNAVKYTPAGGSVTVSAGCDDDRAFVAVRDTGVGIEESALPHIFERFYRVDASRNRDQGGSGLGLSIAKWIAESHGAEIRAESVAGRGSTFRVRFPASA